MDRRTPVELPVQRLARLLEATVRELLRSLGPLVDEDKAWQLTRASNSVVFNTNEALASDTPRKRANFLRIAKGSAGECLGGLNSLDTPAILRTSATRSLHHRASNHARQILGQLKRLIHHTTPT